MDRRLRRAPDAEWVLMYRLGLSRKRIAELVRAEPAAVGYHLVIARRQDPGLEAEHRAAASAAPVPHPSPADLARMAEVIAWVLTEIRLPEDRAGDRAQRSMACWLSTRRREAPRAPWTLPTARAWPGCRGKPVIVLSNNDGCAVTRSPEAKRLGIAMGDPWFKLAPRAKEWGLVALSSNYELYGDISARVMELLGRYSAWLEVYSIDEAFLGVKGTPEELLALGRAMKTTVRRNVGVPVCVGIAPTKTLAKLANKWAKNNPAFDGVCHWDAVPATDRETLMRRLSVIEIWGVATRLTKRLNALGIHSILDLSRADPVMIRDRFSVVMMSTVLELQGTPCIPMEEERIGRDQLIFSRSFATPITTATGIRQIMSVYGQQAAARLAKHGLQAKVLTAFAGTSHFNPNDTSYPTVSVALPMPTADPVILTKAAHALIPRIVDGIRYARAGIMVTDLRPSGNQAPLSLFENPHEERHIGTLLEDVTKKYGRGSIGLGHGGIRGGPDWTMKRDMLSPRYTTHWDELPLVKAA